MDFLKTQFWNNSLCSSAMDTNKKDTSIYIYTCVYIYMRTYTHVYV